MDKFIIYSTLLTIIGLATLGLGHNTFSMLLSCVFLGFGQGAVDITINDFAAKHFSNSLMNFLHAFYGIGVSLSSFIMTFAVQPGHTWQLGVGIIASAQFLIFLLAFVTRNKFKEKAEATVETKEILSEKIKVHHFLLPSFYFFYAVELLIGRFYSSFAVEQLHFSMTVGAAITSFYWAGLMIGRLLTGFTAYLFSGRTIVFSHLILLLIGAGLGFIPHVGLQYLSGTLLGLGLAPLYPTGMKQAYEKYPADTAKRVISFNMAFVNAGMLLIPIPLGILFEQLSFASYPFVIATFGLTLTGLSFLIYTRKSRKAFQ